MTRPIGIDLFAGAGGLSLGFEQAGFDIVAAVELDPIHAATHEFNFPNCTTICRSVVGLSGREIRERARLGNREVDVVFGGAPCQGFSLIGKRALDDPRNQLAAEFVRIVMELKPKYFVFENVKGLTIGSHKLFLEELIALFKLGGNRVVEGYQVLNAAHYGVPQDRQRLFLLGAHADFPLPEYPARKGTVTVAEAIDDLPEVDECPELLERDWVVAKFKRASEYAKRLRGLADDPENYSYPREWDPRLLTSSLRTKHSGLSKRRFRQTTHGDTEPISRYLKLDPDGVCNTLRAGTASDRGAFTSPRPIHPHSDRVITVREAARLHSYPDWFRFHVTKWHGFRQIGNSVPPLLARAVATEVRKALGIAPTRVDVAVSQGDERLLQFDMGDAAAHFNVPHDTIPQRLRVNEPGIQYQVELSKPAAVA
jgi:DNA (cytosine-5)-methyltransferase 1